MGAKSNPKRTEIIFPPSNNQYLFNHYRISRKIAVLDDEQSTSVLPLP